MKFSTAMRLGSMLRPNQAFGRLLDVEANASCAMGAAGEAVGIVDLEAERFKSMPSESWRWLLRMGTCPICWFEYPHVASIVVHLNNEHRWKREAIATWVETIEPADVPVLDLDAMSQRGAA